MDSERRHARVGPGFILGLMLVTAGISSLLERGHVLENVSVGLWWPVLPIMLGIGRIRFGGIERRSGWMLLAFGIWSLVVMLTPISFAETWPLVLLVWGASIMWQGSGASGAVSAMNDAVRATSCQREQRHAG